jgi:phosphatidylserine/phosphatidylglycerophosphate/cardiolipin synthase-like enzyme
MEGLQEKMLEDLSRGRARGSRPAVAAVSALALALLAALALAASPARIEVHAVLVSPDNITELLDYVSSARRAVYAEVYVLTYRPLAEALAAAARRGADVCVVLSARVYGGVPQQAGELAEYLSQSGVRVRWSADFPSVHSKLYVIDNETVIIGNINPTYSGFHRNRGVMLVIRNSTLAGQLAEIVLNDCRGSARLRYGYPGILVSPVNSEEGLSWLLSQPGDLYMAVEEVELGSGLVPLILSHPRRYIVVARADVDIGAVRDENLVAKVIVVGDYAYVGSINLGGYSIHRNREVGLLIRSGELAERLRQLVLRWYAEAGGAPAREGAVAARGVPGHVLHAIVWAVVVAAAAALAILASRRGLRCF